MCLNNRYLIMRAERLFAAFPINVGRWLCQHLALDLKQLEKKVRNV
jgi:hypothetical protein